MHDNDNQNDNEDSIRARVFFHKCLAEDGDYFAVLGVPRDAAGAAIRRSFLDLRRTFDPHRLAIVATGDLVEDARLIVSVLEEAYEILRDPARRDRYLRALESP